MDQKKTLEFNQTLQLYIEDFGKAPFRGLSDLMLLEVLVEMKKALAGERGKLNRSEFTKNDKSTWC